MFTQSRSGRPWVVAASVLIAAGSIGGCGSKSSTSSSGSTASARTATATASATSTSTMGSSSSSTMGGASSSATGGASSTATAGGNRTCSAKQTAATIGGKQKCIEASQQCSKTHVSDYTQYGFTCEADGNRYVLKKAA